MTPEFRAKLKKHPALAAALLYHRNDRGEPMNFREYGGYLLQLYLKINKKEGQKMVVEKSVQCGLTELFIVNVHVEANAGLRCMYVMPLYNLRDRLVQGRVKPLHNRVPFYREKKRQSRVMEGVNRVGLQAFGNGIINFVGSNVESEFLEMSVDSVYIDEKDRCDQENLKLVPGRLTASRYKFQREISNPTIENFGIDRRYLSSTQAQWNIRCDHCGEWFVPDMFKHLVDEIRDNEYRVRDSEYVKHEHAPHLICDKCSKPVDRLGKGAWVTKHDSREYSGFRISQLYSPKIHLGEFLDEEETGWFDAIKSNTGKMIFFNTRLGLPYDASDAKISEAELNACQVDMKYPDGTDQKRQLFIGVDVGTFLHVVIRVRDNSKGDVVFTLLHALTVSGFDELANLLDRHRPRVCAIDALPEGHSVKKLKDDYKNVYSCLFVESALEPNVDKEKRVIKINRTLALDGVKDDVANTRLQLPQDAKNRIPTYYSHLTSPTRILEVDEKKPDNSRFNWISTTPDHYFLAEFYCRAAMLLAPSHDMFDFYRDRNEKMALPDPEMEDAVQDKGKLRVAKLSPGSYLENMRRRQVDKLRGK